MTRKRRIKSKQTQEKTVTAPVYHPALDSKDIHTIETAKFVVKEYFEIIKEYEEAGKTFTESMLYDLRCLLNKVDNDKSERLKTSDLRLYWQVIDASNHHRDLYAKFKETQDRGEF